MANRATEWHTRDSVISVDSHLGSRFPVEIRTDRLSLRRATREGEFRNRIERDGDPAPAVRYSVSQAEWREANGERTATLRWTDEASE